MLAVIPDDALAGVVSAILIFNVWVLRVIWKLNERVAKMEGREERDKGVKQ